MEKKFNRFEMYNEIAEAEYGAGFCTLANIIKIQELYSASTT